MITKCRPAGKLWWSAANFSHTRTQPKPASNRLGGSQRRIPVWRPKKDPGFEDTGALCSCWALHLTGHHILESRRSTVKVFCQPFSNIIELYLILCDQRKCEVILNTRSHINKSWPLIPVSRRSYSHCHFTNLPKMRAKVTKHVNT